MHLKSATSCWDSPTMLVALSRNPERYVRFAQILLDTVPDTWERLSTRLVVTAGKGSRFEIYATRGEAVPPDPDAMMQVYQGLMELAKHALMPNGTMWIGIWVDYDIEGEEMVVTIKHGGPAVRTSPAFELPANENKVPGALLLKPSSRPLHIG